MLQDEGGDYWGTCSPRGASHVPPTPHMTRHPVSDAARRREKFTASAQVHVPNRARWSQ